MIAGGTEGNPGDRPPCYEPQMIQSSPAVTDDIIARRLKNRERQRRYRARKRLEADMKKSCLLGQQALLPSEAQSNGISIDVTPYQVVLPHEAQANGATITYEARVYSGRKWKTDARNAHLSNEQMIPSTVPSVPPILAKPPLEAGSNLECHTTSTGKRDWKADARKKANMDVGTHENDPTK